MQYSVSAPWGLELWLARLCVCGHPWPLQVLWEAVIWFHCAWSINPGLWCMVLVSSAMFVCRGGTSILRQIARRWKTAQ